VEHLLCRAEKFLYVALAIADMDATYWISQKSVDCFRFSNQRMLSFFSIGSRVKLIFFLSAAIPLNFFRVQNLTAASPSGSPWVVTARLECIKIPQTVCSLSTFLISTAVYVFSGLGIGPILANQRNALSHSATDLRQRFAKPAAKPRIPKFASRDFPLNLASRTRSSPHIAPPPKMINLSPKTCRLKPKSIRIPGPKFESIRAHLQTFPQVQAYRHVQQTSQRVQKCESGSRAPGAWVFPAVRLRLSPTGPANR
jgi:hypothetical protein